jgi:hypothetical protein
LFSGRPQLECASKKEAAATAATLTHHSLRLERREAPSAPRASWENNTASTAVLQRE